MSKILALPEVVVAGRTDDPNLGKWKVKGGRAKRGEAWTNPAIREMQVPTEDNEVSQAIRVHELTHARYSPTEADAYNEAEALGVDAELSKVGEEFRINSIMRQIGYNTDLLVDGSEGQSGVDLATDGSVKAWNNAVKFGAALGGCKAFDHFVKGVGTIKPEWTVKLLTMHKDLLEAEADGISSGEMTDDDGYIWGVKRLVNGIIKPLLLDEPNEDEDETEPESGDANSDDMAEFDPESDDVKGKASLGFPIWGHLVLSRPALTVALPPAKMGKTSIAVNRGKRLGNPSRLVTDPHRRVFVSTRKAKGGIVVLDLSGSMSLSNEQIEAMMEAAPAATIIGYAAGYVEAVPLSKMREAFQARGPNCWILGKDGRRVGDIESIERPHGNGVDGPAIVFAASLRKHSGEAVVWVTDGGVTGFPVVLTQPEPTLTGRQVFNATLAEDAAKLVRRHRVTVVSNIDLALGVLVGKYPQRVHRGELVTNSVIVGGAYLTVVP